MESHPLNQHGRVSASAPAIPGLPTTPAFRLDLSEASPVPVLIAVPHAGRAYPSGLLARMRDPASAALRLEDRYVDRLAERVAQATGAGLLQAYAPRAMIDLNRAPEEMDWTMLRRGAGQGTPRPKLSRRARSGLGLVPRKLSGLGEIWRDLLAPPEMEERIDKVHTPYHAALQQSLARLHARWGAALLLDFHSMPPIEARGPHSGTQLVIGDRFGASCDGGLVAASFGACDRLGLKVAHNRPYAGGYVLERHADPRKGIHAIQLEICRRTYLDTRLAEPGEHLAAMADRLIEIVRVLAAETAILGRAGTVSQAAE